MSASVLHTAFYIFGKQINTNIVKDKVHGKTKYSRTNWVKQNRFQFAFKILCNVFHFLFENLPPE